MWVWGEAERERERGGGGGGLGVRVQFKTLEIHISLSSCLRTRVYDRCYTAHIHHPQPLSSLPPFDPSFPSTMSTGSDVPLLDAAGVEMGDYDPNCPMPIVELLRREEIAAGKDDPVPDPNRAAKCFAVGCTKAGDKNKR